jgi:competence protein ComGC
MNIQFLYQLIAAAITKNDDDGLTLMELIAVIFMIIIVLFFTLPSLMNYAFNSGLHINEAKGIIGGMNSEQTYLIKNDGKFASSIDELRSPGEVETINYRYSIQIRNDSAFHYGIAKTDYLKTGWFEKKPLRSVVGAVFKIPNTKKSQSANIRTREIVCINEQPGAIFPPKPILDNGIPRCELGTTDLKKSN